MDYYDYAQQWRIEDACTCGEDNIAPCLYHDQYGGYVSGFIKARGLIIDMLPNIDGIDFEALEKLGDPK